jgi:hypothetical protein
VKDDLAGRPQHIERLGISYMYMGQWVPGVSGGEFHVGPYIMVVTPHPEDLQGFTRGGWNGTYIIHFARRRSTRSMVFGFTDSSS